MINVLVIGGSFPPVKDGVGDFLNLIRVNLKYKEDGSIKTYFYIVNTEVYINSTISEEDLHIMYDKTGIVNIIEILKFIRKVKPDIVRVEYRCLGYGYSLWINFLPAVIKLFYPSIHIQLSLHEYLSYTWKGRSRVELMLKFSNSILVYDKANHEILARKLDDKKPLLLLFSPSVVPLNSEKRDFITGKQSLIFAYWGFIRANKGLDILLKAFRIYLDSGKQGLLYILAELDSGDKYHTYILNLIGELNLTKYIVIKGYLPETAIAEEIQKTDICVLPFTDGVSDRRTTFSAAMSLGMPVITTLRDPKLLPDGLVNQVNVFLVEPQEIEGLAESMRILENGKIRNGLAVEAQKWARSRSWDNHVNRLKSYWLNIASEKTRESRS